MKKIVSILLTVFVFVGLMSTVSFAVGDYPPQWELSDFGQQNWTLYLNDKSSPKVDGKVNEGEYALEIADLAVADDASDDRIFTVDNPGDVVLDVYMDYDGDFLYVGVVIDDPSPCIEDGKIPDDRLYIYIGGDKDNLMRDNALSFKIDVGAVTATNASQVKTSVDGTVITYEFTVDRYTIMDKYGFDELDQVYLQMILIDITEESLVNTVLDNEVWFGFTTRDLVDIYPAHTSGNARFRYPHVIYFVDEPETEAPVTEAPETEAPETEVPETEIPETEIPETEAPETEPVAEGGCGASVATIGVVLVASLGSCIAFVSNKK